MASCSISKETLRRLISDIKEIRKNPLHSHGIYYEHNEDDLLKGKVLIIGPNDTPYQNGFYFFNVDFPVNYPYAPPKVTFCTNDGQTRFNPNLYRCGKVCLSILNTWQGEQWSACQTITSVLLALCTVFNDKPLLNEPGLTIHHRDYDNYNRILKYKNIEIGVLRMLENENIQQEFAVFTATIRAHFKENTDKIQQTIREEIEKNEADDDLVVTSVYQLRCNINYKVLLERVKELRF
jgi:ubiquitin-protein ligase